MHRKNLSTSNTEQAEKRPSANLKSSQFLKRQGTYKSEDRLIFFLDIFFNSVTSKVKESKVTIFNMDNS